MGIAQWSLAIGTLLVVMVLTGSLLKRLPLSGAIIYLALGWLLGPDALDVLRPDPRQQAALLGHFAEVALLISLFSVGMQLGVPLRDPRWRLPVKLAFIAMTAMVALLAAVGVIFLGLSLGAAILLGAVLAPTDPVLASAVRSEPGPAPDRLGFGLAGEGGLNDGTAFPFVMLGLGLLDIQGFDSFELGWWCVKVVWEIFGGIAIGAALGVATGRLVIYLRTRHSEALGLDEFLSLGLVGMAYGLAQLSLTSGFLAVFAAGMALQRVREKPNSADVELASFGDGVGDYRRQANAMRDSVQAFNRQLENLVIHDGHPHRWPTSISYTTSRDITREGFLSKARARCKVCWPGGERLQQFGGNRGAES